MHKLYHAALTLAIILVLAGCTETATNPQDTPGGGSKWVIAWEYVDTTACPVQIVNGDFHWALRWRGTDTIVVESQDGSYMVTHTGVKLESMTLEGLGKCPDDPDNPWSEMQLIRDAVLTGEPFAESHFEPLPVAMETPTNLVVNTGSAFTPGMASHRSLAVGSNDQNELLGEGAFTFAMRFKWPLTDKVTFDSTSSFDQGGMRTRRTHAVLTKIQ